MPALTAEDAAALHTAFVADMIERLQQLPGIDLELHTDILSDAWMEFKVARKLQIPGDLGLKMVHSLANALASGYERAMIVGTDAPTLPTSYLKGLLQTEADVSLGPTDDGGYYAVSAKRTQSGMFDGVAWSTANTLVQTEVALAQCGLSAERGEPWWDVDEPADLERLRASSNLPPRTKRLLIRLESA